MPHSAFRTTVVPPGRQMEVLRSLPIGVLRLSLDTVQLLSEFDIGRIGQLLELPRADLPARFGNELLLRLDQALGAVPELLLPERPAEALEAAWTFEPPAADRQVLEAVFGRLIEGVLDRLHPRQLGMQRLLCTLELVAGEPLHFPIELLRPTLSLRHLRELVRLRIERLPIPAEVSAVAIQAMRVAPLEFRQGRLFDDGPERWRQVTALLERLSSRLGAKAVLRPELRADAQPEYACRYEPWLLGPRRNQGLAASPLVIDGRPFGATGFEAPQGRSSIARGEALRTPGLSLRTPGLSGLSGTPGPAHHIPTCLKAQPVAVPVSAERLEALIQFQWEENHYIVAHYWGPERIETGWWRGADVSRDYYLVETLAGERFWLFRSLSDDSWFLHGIFA